MTLFATAWGGGARSVATRAHYDDLLVFLRTESLGARACTSFARESDREPHVAETGRAVVESMAADPVFAEATAILAGRSRNS